MDLTQIKRVTRKLPLRKLKLLDEWLQGLIRKAESEKGDAEQSSSSGRVVEERAVASKTYRLQGVCCGKENCKCARGELHGPYWYSYSRVEGKVKSRYVGKKLPDKL